MNNEASHGTNGVILEYWIRDSLLHSVRFVEYFCVVCFRLCYGGPYSHSDVFVSFSNSQDLLPESLSPFDKVLSSLELVSNLVAKSD